MKYLVAQQIYAFHSKSRFFIIESEIVTAQLPVGLKILIMLFHCWARNSEIIKIRVDFLQLISAKETIDDPLELKYLIRNAKRESLVLVQLPVASKAG